MHAIGLRPFGCLVEVVSPVVNSIKHIAALGLYKIVGTLSVEATVVSHTASRAPLRRSRCTVE